MSQAAAQARSDDVSSLRDHGLSYVAAMMPDNVLVPNILAKSKKSQTCGFLHPQLGSLLCPVDKHNDYIKDVDRYMLLLS